MFQPLSFHLCVFLRRHPAKLHGRGVKLNYLTTENRRSKLLPSPKIVCFGQTERDPEVSFALLTLLVLTGLHASLLWLQVVVISLSLDPLHPHELTLLFIFFLLGLRVLLHVDLCFVFTLVGKDLGS
jgi:hypothetical protein